MASIIDKVRNNYNEYMSASIDIPTLPALPSTIITTVSNGSKTGTLLGRLKATDNGQIVVSDRDWDQFDVSLFTYYQDNVLTVDDGIVIADIFAIGDKVKLSQGGTTKYFYIVDFAGQLLQLSAGDDYTYTNAQLDTFETSRSTNPLGHPIFFDYDTTMYVGASSVTLTSNLCAFRMVGPVVEFNTFVYTTAFPSGAAVFSLETPFVDISSARANASGELVINTGAKNVTVENENSSIGGGAFSGIAQNVFNQAGGNYASGDLVFRAVTNAYLSK